MTMIELVVGMGLMTVFLTIFTSSVVMMNRSANKAQSLTDTSAALSVAFNKLDKQVRYASAINTVGQGSDGNWYVEFQTTNTGTPVCTQLRLNQTTQKLEQRTWVVTQVTATPPTTAASGLSNWQPMASGIVNGNASPTSTDKPFTFIAATPTLTFQQLTVHLLATSGGNNAASTSLTSITFTALNTTITTQSNSVCKEVGRP
jgi:hypothetical protein